MRPKTVLIVFLVIALIFDVVGSIIAMSTTGGGASSTIQAADFPVRFDSSAMSNSTVQGKSSMSLLVSPTTGDYIVIDSYSCWSTNTLTRVRVASVSDNQTTLFSYKLNEIVVSGTFAFTKLNEEIWTGKFTGSKTDNITVTWANSLGTTGLSYSVNRFIASSYMNVNTTAKGNTSNSTTTSSSLALSFPATRNGGWVVGGSLNSYLVSGLNTASATISIATGQFQRNTFTNTGTSQAGGSFSCAGDIEDADQFSVVTHSFSESFSVSTRWAGIALEMLPLTVLPNPGPCTYFIQKSVTSYVVTAKVDIGGMMAGQSVFTTNTNDFGAFFQPFINNEIARGGGYNCFDNGEYDISGSSICNITGAGQSCGLWMKGHGIYLACLGFSPPSFGVSISAPNLTPCYIKYTGGSSITCLLCWGTFNATLEYYAGGTSGLTIDGNGIVKDCVETADIQHFTMHASASVNCVSNDLHMMAAEAGGTSGDIIDQTTFGVIAVAITTGQGVFLDAGIAQTWVINNFFVVTYGTAILVAGGAGGNTNLISFNHIENCKTGSSGGYKAGTCIYDIDSFDIISYNQMTIQADYNCIYAAAFSMTINNNVCLQPNTGNFSDGSCVFIETSVSNIAVTNNLCNNNGGGGSGNMKYGVDCFACGTGMTITSNTIIGASITGVNFYNGASEGITNVIARDNTGYNPVGHITNFICTTCAVNAWAPVGTGSTVVASTTYTIAFIDQEFSCSANASVGGGVTISSPDGTIVENAIAIATFCGQSTPVWIPIGWTINFGAFTGGPPLITDIGN